MTSLGQNLISETIQSHLPDLWQRVAARCVWIGDCFVWQGATSHGYGRISVEGRLVPVHRIAYQYVHGPIPQGLTIDHVKQRGCQSRGCCHAPHLEAVTHRENLLRGNGFPGHEAQQTHCLRGHRLSGWNLLRWGHKHRKRVCRICHYARTRAYRRAKRSEA